MCFSVSRIDQTWTVTFKQPPQPKPLGRQFRFADPEKIRSLYDRFGSRRLLEDKAAFDLALESGSGIVELMLGSEEMAKLR